MRRSGRFFITKLCCSGTRRELSGYFGAVKGYFLRTRYKGAEEIAKLSGEAGNG